VPEDLLSERDAGSPKIKVVDRRRFDESGEPRPDRPPPAAKAPPSGDSQPAPGRVATTSASSPHGDTRTPAPEPPSTTVSTQPLFLELIAGLAQQAEMLLAGAQGVPAAPAEARQVIEVLSMLENKTRGNLSAEEQQILSNVIFQLRTMYVQRTQ
jgi:hypothetical protein